MGTTERIPIEHVAAVHEAGHAMIGHALGFHVDTVTLDDCGFVDDHPRATIHNALIDCAGVAAELELLRIASRVAGDDARGFRKTGCNFEDTMVGARYMVRKHRQSIVRVAAALLKRRTLTGSQVARLALIQ